LPYIQRNPERIAQLDSYDINGDSVPSVNKVIGYRELTNYTQGRLLGGGYVKEYTYTVGYPPADEMIEYLEYLQYNENFACLSDTLPKDLDRFKMYVKGVRLANESKQAGYIIIVEVNWDFRGYVITVSRIKGKLARLSDADNITAAVCSPAFKMIVGTANKG